MLSDKMTAWTSQKGANPFIVRLPLFCWVVKFQNAFHFLLLCFLQPCEHEAVHSCSCLFLTVPVVGAYKDICLLVGGGEWNPNQPDFYTFTYLLLFLLFWSARKLFRERITVETSVPPTSEGERVCGKKGRSAVSSWSPAAMTVTRTSTSAELMAPDNCVMGSYHGQRFTAAALHNGATMCLTACWTILHRRPDLWAHAHCISLRWALIWLLTAAS